MSPLQRSAKEVLLGKVAWRLLGLVRWLRLLFRPLRCAVVRWTVLAKAADRAEEGPRRFRRLKRRLAAFALEQRGKSTTECMAAICICSLMLLNPVTLGANTAL